MMQRRVMLGALWFSALLVWNIAMQHAQYTDEAFTRQLHIHEVLALGAAVQGTGFLKEVMEAVGYMTTPVELLLTAVVLVILWKWRGKTLTGRR